MSLADLTALTLIGRPSLDDGPEDTVRVRAKLRHTLADADDAAALHGVFPALRSYFLRATNEDAPPSPFRLLWTVSEEPMRIELGAQGQFGGPAALLRAQATLSQKGAHVDLWVRWDIEPAMLPEIAALLRVMGVTATIDPAQMRLPFAEVQGVAA